MQQRLVKLVRNLQKYNFFHHVLLCNPCDDTVVAHPPSTHPHVHIHPYTGFFKPMLTPLVCSFLSFSVQLSKLIFGLSIICYQNNSNILCERAWAASGAQVIIAHDNIYHVTNLPINSCILSSLAGDDGPDSAQLLACARNQTNSSSSSSIEWALAQRQ